MSKTNYLENAILDHLTGNGSLATPAQLYLGLLKSDPGEVDIGTSEIDPTTDDAAYVRQPISFSTAADGTVVSTNDQFFAASAADNAVTHAGIFDAETAGNLLYYMVVPGGLIFRATGSVLKFLASFITISED
jgi:hypothetical protein